jgi:hypothetical protein
VEWGEKKIKEKNGTKYRTKNRGTNAWVNEIPVSKTSIVTITLKFFCRVSSINRRKRIPKASEKGTA